MDPDHALGVLEGKTLQFRASGGWQSIMVVQGLGRTVRGKGWAWAKEEISRGVTWSLHAVSNKALETPLLGCYPKPQAVNAALWVVVLKSQVPPNPLSARNHYAIFWDQWLDKTLPFMEVSRAPSFVGILLEHASLMVLRFCDMYTHNCHIHAKLPDKWVEWTEHVSGKQKVQGWILALLLISCVTLSKSLKHSVPQLLHLRNGQL